MNRYMVFPELPFIAILRGLELDQAVIIGELLVKEGFNILEVPLNRPGALDCISALARNFGKEAIVGAGTVLTVEDVRAVAKAGGRLVVSPDTNPEVIRAATAAGIPSLPGAATPTEAFTALHAGAVGIKVFPAETIGPAGLKAWRAVLPAEVPLVPVGGVVPESVAVWLTAGAGGFGVGSPLYVPGRPLADIAARAAAFREAFRQAKAGAIPA